jgi:hypothetical protein
VSATSLTKVKCITVTLTVSRGQQPDSRQPHEANQGFQVRTVDITALAIRKDKDEAGKWSQLLCSSSGNMELASMEDEKGELSCVL